MVGFPTDSLDCPFPSPRVPGGTWVLAAVPPGDLPPDPLPPLTTGWGHGQRGNVPPVFLVRAMPVPGGEAERQAMPTDRRGLGRRSAGVAPRLALIPAPFGRSPSGTPVVLCIRLPAPAPGSRVTCHQQKEHGVRGALSSCSFRWRPLTVTLGWCP